MIQGRCSPASRVKLRRWSLSVLSRSALMALSAGASDRGPDRRSPCCKRQPRLDTGSARGSGQPWFSLGKLGDIVGRNRKRLNAPTDRGRAQTDDYLREMCRVARAAVRLPPPSRYALEPTNSSQPTRTSGSNWRTLGTPKFPGNSHDPPPPHCRPRWPSALNCGTSGAHCRSSSDHPSEWSRWSRPLFSPGSS